MGLGRWGLAAPVEDYTESPEKLKLREKQLEVALDETRARLAAVSNKEGEQA
jgi:hypothetical protein